MRTRTVLPLTAALLAVAPASASAIDHASVHVAADGSAEIEVFTPPPRAELYLMRGTTAWSGHSGVLNVPSLLPGETITVRHNGAPYATLTYSGLPNPKAGACAGSTTVHVDDGSGVALRGASLVSPERSAYDVEDSTAGFVMGGDVAQAAFPRPLRLGDTLRLTAATAVAWPGGPIPVETVREFSINTVCTPAADPPGPGVTFTPAVDLRPARTQLRKLDPAKLARKQRMSLSVALTGPGKLQLRLTAKQRKKTLTLATGTATAKRAGTAKVSLRLTKQGRALLRRSKRLKVSLATTFTPVGAKPGKQQFSVTLKRPAKKR